MPVTPREASLREPMLAYSRTGPSHQSATRESINHATVDGKTTLCGLREIGGFERTVPFTARMPFACKRCAGKVRSLLGAER